MSQSSEDGLSSDVPNAMLARLMKAGTKAAIYSGPPRGGMLNFKPAVFRSSHVHLLQASTEERGYQQRAEIGAYTAPMRGPTSSSAVQSGSVKKEDTDQQGISSADSTLSYEDFYKTWIEPNKGHLHYILREFNWNLHGEDKATENQFFTQIFENHHNNTASIHAPSSAFSGPPHITFNHHIGFLHSMSTLL